MTTKEYNSVVREVAGRLMRFTNKLVRDESLADDIVQDSFMKLWLNVNKIEFIQAKSWLFTTAYRESLHQLSLKKRSFEHNPVPNTRLDNPNPDLKEILDKCLSTLPEIHKSILMLRDYEGYEYKEIGEILDLSESQVKVYLFRARSKMKDLIRNINIII